MSFTLVREHKFLSSETTIWPRLTASNAINYHLLHAARPFPKQISGSGTWDVMRDAKTKQTKPNKTNRSEKEDKTNQDEKTKQTKEDKTNKEEKTKQTRT